MALVLIQNLYIKPTHMKKNSGKYALITGATSGIGLELANLFDADAVKVVLNPGK